MPEGLPPSVPCPPLSAPLRVQPAHPGLFSPVGFLFALSDPRSPLAPGISQCTLGPQGVINPSQQPLHYSPGAIYLSGLLRGRSPHPPTSALRTLGRLSPVRSSGMVLSSCFRPCFSPDSLRLTLRGSAEASVLPGETAASHQPFLPVGTAVTFPPSQPPALVEMADLHCLWLARLKEDRGSVCPSGPCSPGPSTVPSAEQTLVDVG